MKGFVYLVLLATVFFTLKELLGFDGILGGIVGGGISGAIVTIAFWGIEKLIARIKKK